MTTTVVAAAGFAALGMSLRPLAPGAATFTRWLRSRWLLVAWDVPLTRHWEPRCWPGAWSTATSRWVRL